MTRYLLTVCRRALTCVATAVDIAHLWLAVAG